jgi:hypothetical protein
VCLKAVTRIDLQQQEEHDSSDMKSTLTGSSNESGSKVSERNE